MLDIVVNLVAFVFVLGILVVIHEAGHFVVARLLGAPVTVFSVGFGKRLAGFVRGGTDYRLSAIPFGGYVRIVGLGPDESDAVGALGEETDDSLLPRWRRGLILLAGPLTNVMAAACFLAFAFVLGVEMPAYQDEPPVVGWVEPDSPAAAAGIETGDRVVALDGKTVESWRELETSLLTSGGREVALVLARGGERLERGITPRRVTRYGFGYSGLLPPLEPIVVRLQASSPAEAAGLRPGDRIVEVEGEAVDQFYDLIRLISPHPDQSITLVVERDQRRFPVTLAPRDVGGEGKIGVALVFPTTLRKLGPVAALGAGARECYRMTLETMRVIGRLVTRRASLRQVSGPLDIARISGEAARSGVRSLVWFMGLISLQLGIVNLLPIPVLDGGHLTVIGIESLIRRDLSTRVKERIIEVGLVLLVALMVVVLFNDILKIVPDGIYRFFFPAETP